MPIATVKVDGRDAQVNFQTYETLTEEWSEYRLKDGTKIKIKPAILRVGRILDDHGEPAVTPDGSPAVCVTSNTLILAE